MRSNIEYIPECSEIEKALARLVELSNLSFEVCQEVSAFLERVPHLIELDVIDDSAIRTGKVRVVFKPSDALLSFMTTLEARYG